jgi:hypothetical protein
MENLAQDLRYAVRLVGKTPGLAAAVVLSVTLGVGLNTAIFSLIDTVMLRSLPVERPEQLVLFGDDPNEEIGSTVEEGRWQSFPLPLYKYFQENDQRFRGICAFKRASTGSACFPAQPEKTRVHGLPWRIWFLATIFR